MQLFVTENDKRTGA